jgi:hypothetical protein
MLPSIFHHTPSFCWLLLHSPVDLAAPLHSLFTDYCIQSTDSTHIRHVYQISLGLCDSTNSLIYVNWWENKRSSMTLSKLGCRVFLTRFDKVPCRHCRSILEQVMVTNLIPKSQRLCSLVPWIHSIKDWFSWISQLQKPDIRSDPRIVIASYCIPFLKEPEITIR